MHYCVLFNSLNSQKADGSKKDQLHKPSSDTNCLNEAHLSNVFLMLCDFACHPGQVS